MKMQTYLNYYNEATTTLQEWVHNNPERALYLALAGITFLLILLVVLRKKRRKHSLTRSAKGLDLALSKTRTGLLSSLKNIIGLGRTIDEDFLEELQGTLLSADIGAPLTAKLILQLEEDWAGKKIENNNQITDYLKKQLDDAMGETPAEVVREENSPHVILIVGVNGSGKTTSIGKLANTLVKGGSSVLLGAADTFRAAAAEQLEVWAERSGSQIVRQNEGAAPSSVAFDATEAAVARKQDVLIVDTAGRLHNKKNLMAELMKLRAVIEKKIPGAPHEVLMVIDACTGQNALNQVKTFGADVGVTGIIATKLDGTAKGGILLAIQRDLGIPIRYIGTGEGIDDFAPFDKDTFISALFS